MHTHTTLEKIPCTIFENQKDGSLHISEIIYQTIQETLLKKNNCVLGFPTGKSPILVYQNLVALYKKGAIDFEKIHIFLLDEYYTLPKEHPNSFYMFLHKHLLQHIDIPATNIHSLDGGISKECIPQHTKIYEEKIKELGGIDLMLLGIGTNGHIGFNEPGSHIHSKTRLVALKNSTRIDNHKAFKTLTEMPYLGISIGIATILQSKKIILMAWGANKAQSIQKAVEGKITDEIPASMLQLHDNVHFILDSKSSELLTRFQAPWLTGACTWDLSLMKKAVITLALSLKKPILSLTEKDYIENGLGELIAYKKDAYEANLDVFYALRDSITGWPGGKPSPLPNHPEREKPYPKRVLIFSPHPDDDIISMGGTFMRLHNQGHNVNVAYQTSGNIAVTDEFLTRFLDFALGFQDLFQLEKEQTETLIQEARTHIKNKKHLYDKDIPAIRAIKGLIRRCEAKATCRYVGIPEKNIFFQNLPFYETGTIVKNPISPADITQTINLLETIRPHQIYCAGDLADPHGTHKTCLDIVFQAIHILKEKKTDWLQDCWVWMYKGAWQEWDISEIEMAIPMSPEQVHKKRFGIFIHQSQKDLVPFQGNDNREFWQRAEDRNKNTADLYSALGLTHYAAMEAFVRWHF